MLEPRRAWAVGLGSGLLLILILLALPAGQQVATDRRLSTYRTTPDGAGAVYQTLERLGLPVDRRLTPMVDADTLPRALALLAPTIPLTPRERAALLEWVESGGQLIMVPSYWRAGVESLFGLVHDWHDEPRAEVRDHPWTVGIDRVDPGHWTLADTTTHPGRSWTPLIVHEPTGEAMVGVLRLGQGRVLAVADPEALTNQSILESGVLPILARAARDMAGGGAEATPLVFDEFHHGHRGGSAGAWLWDTLTETPAGRAALQALLVGVLALLPLAVRFGAPVAPAPAYRRSPLEHARALGEVYRASGAAGIARRRLIVGFARRIGRERPAPGQEDQFLDRLARSALRGNAAVTELRARWNAGGRDLLGLAREMDRTANQLRGHSWKS